MDFAARILGQKGGFNRRTLGKMMKHGDSNDSNCKKMM
jgi:hypothetical protein